METLHEMNEPTTDTEDNPYGSVTEDVDEGDDMSPDMFITRKIISVTVKPRRPQGTGEVAESWLTDMNRLRWGREGATNQKLGGISQL